MTWISILLLLHPALALLLIVVSVETFTTLRYKGREAVWPSGPHVTEIQLPNLDAIPSQGFPPPPTYQRDPLWGYDNMMICQS